MATPQTPSTDLDQAPKQDLSKDIKNLVASADTLLQDAVKTGTEELGCARANVEEKFYDTKSTIQQVGTTLSDKAKEAAATTQAFVEKNPWKSLGIMMASGLILGAIGARL